MHAQSLRRQITTASLIAASALAAPRAATADDTGLLGRLFRLGGTSNAAKSKPTPAPLPYGSGGEKAGVGRNHEHDHAREPGDAFIPPAAARGPAPTPTAGPIGEGPSTPAVSEHGPAAPPITPRSRVSNAATDADPLLTRMALGRSNDGSQFGMFLQVYADGTVIDSEGVHRLAPADLKPIADLVASGELGRNRGHCGSPSSDYIEEVHVVVFERRLGRLTAQPFSYSGNPQGCDPSVRQLHTLVEGLQARLSGQPAAAAVTPPAAEGDHAAGPAIAPPSAASAFSPSSAAARPAAVPGRGAIPPSAVGTGRVLPPLSPATSPASANAPTGVVIPLTPAGSP
ncbi:hypothetical protein [Paludisphaera mucosa]|uniref:Uncharacterized protein n=1 Tax=Paludisphaera mucosa TaxID=3030827 RepID=A0ABT6FBB1_9BACT|nr:hypothetical protein [Paludisphaera mucosa]MDG3004729.1 hypothetical protein [Paludisphaera mucosa]